MVFFLFFSGELVVGEPQRVAMLSPLSERDSDRYGNLFITNYRLSFVPLELTQNDVSYLCSPGTLPSFVLNRGTY